MISDFPLPGGGSLSIEPTRALIAVDAIGQEPIVEMQEMKTALQLADHHLFKDAELTHAPQRRFIGQ